MSYEQNRKMQLQQLKTTDDVDSLRSIINKLINVENPTYTEDELSIIKDLTDRYNKEILCEYCGYLKPDHEERCILKIDILNNDIK